MSKPTPTPRTDAATYPADCLGATLVTNRDLARELERELAAERARLDWFHEAAGDRIWVASQDIRAAIDAAMKEDAK